MLLRSPLTLFMSRTTTCLPRWNIHLLRPRQLQAYRHFQTGPEKLFRWRKGDSTEKSPATESNRVGNEGVETPESKLFSLDSSLASRLSTDRKIKCTTFNDKGDIEVGNFEIKKSDLVARFGILSRDLRKIDDAHDFPAILVRQSTILVNLLQHRALITANSILVLHVDALKTGETDDSTFKHGLKGKLDIGLSQHGNLPYELRALETILIMVISELEAEYQKVKNPVNDLLEELNHDVSLEKLKKLLDVSKQASSFRQKVKLVRSALHTVLEADDDMAAMYLSEKAAGQPRAEANHEEVEMLLENYYDASGEIVEKADKLLSDVEFTHDSVKSILDSHRNSIMMLEVHFSVAMLSIATGTYMAGLYGMNLIHGLEEAVHGFTFITGCSAVGIFAVAIFGALKLRRIKKVYNLHSMQHIRGRVRKR